MFDMDESTLQFSMLFLTCTTASFTEIVIFFASTPGSNFVENHQLRRKIKKEEVTLTESTADGLASRMATGCL